MKVLVTGGAGFIGSHIVERLLRAGVQVCVLDNLCTGSLANLPHGVAFHQRDIRDNEITEYFMEQRFDYVVHQAAQTMVPKSLLDPRYDCDVNVLGLVNVLEACRLSGVKRVVFASSAAVYGDTEKLPIEETAQKNPTSFYGLSKLTEELYLDMYNRNFGLEYVVLRYANVYGERQGDSGEGGVISIFTKQMLTGQPLKVFGDGTQTRDFVYVRDVAEANYQALLTRHSGRVYNISTGKEVSVNTLIELLARAIGVVPTVKYTLNRGSDISRSALLNKAAQVFLQWQPRYSLFKGLEMTLAKMQENTSVMRTNTCFAKEFEDLYPA